MAPLADATNSPVKVTKPRKSFMGKMFGSTPKRANSYSLDAMKEATKKKESAEAIDAAAVTTTEAPCFYAVVHTFNEGMAEKFWGMMATLGPDEMAAMSAKWHGMGYHNHNFLPSGTHADKVLCLWECKADTPAETFQNFIDGPDGPGEGIFQNACYKVMPGAVTPAAFFADGAAPAAPVKSSGSFFWVYHSFKEGAAPAFWEMIGGMSPDDFAAMADKHAALGFHNHAFLPLGEAGPCVCIWESKHKMEPAAFQAFIDGPDGPGAGAVFDNVVHAAMEGAALPSAKFTPPFVAICPPCGTAPDKAFGPEGAQAKMWLNKLPGGKQMCRICIDKGFDWRASIGPVLGKEWCPATHFGYLESGSMGIITETGEEYTIKAGEQYLVEPGHIPTFSEDAVMVEFTQDTTYTAMVKK